MAPALLAALTLLLAADPAVDLAVQPGSALTYHLVHKFHAVDGVTRAVEGRVRIGPDGAVQAMVRAPVASFDSGNGNRDAHMKEVVEAHRFPFVTLKAVGRVARPTSYPATVEVPLEGQLELHGQVHPVAVTASVRFEAPDKASVQGKLTISLDAYGVERPALMFVKVEDALAVEADLRLAPP